MLGKYQTLKNSRENFLELHNPFYHDESKNDGNIIAGYTMLRKKKQTRANSKEKRRLYKDINL